MVTASAVVLLALVASVLGGCELPSISPLESFDKSKLVGSWTTVWWPKEYETIYKCGTETFEIDGNHVAYTIRQKDIASGLYSSNNTGVFYQWGEGGNFFGHRHGWDHLIRWSVLGFEEEKWISFWQCTEELGHAKSFVLKKEGATLTPEDQAKADAARPNPPDYYGTESYANC